jgi:glucose/mannose transport system substrate-binding protein
MPVNIHRENTLFYNKQIFAAHNLQPPTTTRRADAGVRDAEGGGRHPIATAHQGWILRIMFNTLAMGSMGADAFNAYMTGGPRDDAALSAAIDVFADVLANYVNANASSTDFGWTNAAARWRPAAPRCSCTATGRRATTSSWVGPPASTSA